MSNLIARFADSTFWLARYVERAEDLARILDVNETFARDQQGANHWLPIVRLHADEARFHATHRNADAETVIRFYVFDRDNPASIVSSVGFARENAVVLRHLISTEMWTHLNVFYHQLLETNAVVPIVPRLSPVCTWIKESCQAHYGIMEGTLYRDQTWYFYQIGKMIERADQITRLLDISYHTPKSSDDERDREVENAKWNAVLRSAAGYHAFRRVHPRGMDPEAVASFLLFDDSFPRSLSLCMAQIDSLHLEMEDIFDLRNNEEVNRILEDGGRHILGMSAQKMSSDELHENLDAVQKMLVALTSAIGRSYFGHVE